MKSERREADKESWVLVAADSLLDHLRPDGRVEITDTQYPESHTYLAGDLFPLLESYRISNDEKYLNGARRILDYFRENQRDSGGWTFGFLEVGGERSTTLGGYGSYRELTDKVTAAASGWSMAAVRKYERITGDQSYRPMVAKAVGFLDSAWDDSWGFDDGTQRAIFKDALAIVGLSVWQDVYPRAEALLSKAIESVTTSPRFWNEREKNWVADVGGQEPGGAPVTCTMSCALLEAAGAEFAQSHARPALDAILAHTEHNCAHNRALMPHWPYRQDRADIRGNTYLILLMKLLDVTTGTTVYRQTRRYSKVASWLATMRDEQGFLEYENCRDGTRGSHASPAQFLTSFWVCGTYKWD